jgi:hypothetical protein
VTWHKSGCFRVKVDFLEGADLPERLEPVIAAFAVELPALALEYADVAGDVSRRCSVADLEAFLGGLVEPAWVYIVEQGEDSVDLVSGCAIEGLEDFGDSLFGDTLQRGGWSLELFAVISDRSLSSSFIGRNWEGYCARSGRGRSLNYCACERDSQRACSPTVAGATLTTERLGRASSRETRFGARESHPKATPRPPQGHPKAIY